ncbi:hypothetical protein [Amycolatopsis sp. NPDC051903]|uniref:hypothetical protein n=1 Tax=Amycolatopsis sp. NPDC051903 TaxID=3363936 RepID=UPI0037962FC4
MQVIDIGAPTAPVDEGDDDLPIRVRWPDARAGETSHHRLREGEDARAGFVDLGYDATTGAVVAITVVVTPARAAVLPSPDVPAVAGTVRLRPQPWAAGRHTDEDAVLSIATDAEVIYVGFAETSPVRFVTSGFAAFGLDADDRLVGFRTRALTRSGGR